MTGLVVALITAAALLGLAEGTRMGRRRRARDKLSRDAIARPEARGPAITRLREEIRALEHTTGLGTRLMGTRAVARELSEARLSLALLLLVDDRPEEALDVLVLINPDRIPQHLQAVLALHAIEAHLRLGEWDAAERVLDGYSASALNANGQAMRANARAQIRLGRGDARAALRVLDEAEPVPDPVRPELDLTRARALAAEGRDAAEVWRILSAQPKGALELLLRRHGGEPATQVARRILDGEGPYR
ncbi:MAG TPA: hypothetical protein VMZ28_07875 [Kofleriaceae bacterium]|nr:hypothetical protein [Kofleriaceae bacterium]